MTVLTAPVFSDVDPVIVPGRVSIIIPTHNHARWLADAVESALAQTVPCEVIVVDDGSTDRTAAVLARYAAHPRVAVLTQAQAGPSAARNAGLSVASGEFIMFLDADDVIAPDKIARQLAAFDDEVGWVLCDVSIEDEARGTVRTASVQYGYARKDLGGWIQPLLEAANFIPIMAPLVRRAVIGAIRFDDQRVPEDWYFWRAIAGVARCRYLPAVLATYRHRRVGRSRVPKPARVVAPRLRGPLRLNLGCGTRVRPASWRPIDGMVNLDKSLGWRFEDGLGDFLDGSVEGITISHALMYVAAADWPAVVRECARVLAPGGVIRITEDDTAHPASARLGGWQGSEPAVTLTSPAWVRAALEAAGLAVFDVSRTETHFADRSLCQAHHGAPPDVFFVEGVKPGGVLFAPHNDDETLFAAFTVLRHRPRVIVCYPSTRDYGDAAVRAAETRAAVAVLQGGPVEQWDGRDLVAQMRALQTRLRPTQVWAPSADASHPDHVLVARAAQAVFADRLTAYQTYDVDGKVRRGTRVAPAQPLHVARKLLALHRYASQIAHPRAGRFFLWDLEEYFAEVGK